MKIKTNRHWHEFLYRHEVPEKVLAYQFDWLDEEDGSDGFIKYRGRYYHVSEFMRTDSNPNLAFWHGYISDSFFSGVLIRLSSDGEQYQIATYLS